MYTTTAENIGISFYSVNNKYKRAMECFQSLNKTYIRLAVNCCGDKDSSNAELESKSTKQMSKPD